MKSKDDLLAEALEHIKSLEADNAEMQVMIERLTSPPFQLATICQVIAHEAGDRVLLAAGSGWPSIIPAPTDKAIVSKLKAGALVSVNGMTGAIAEVFEHPLPGIEATVRRVFDASNMIEIDGGGNGAMQVYKGAALADCKAGDIVLMDRTGQVALQKIKKDRTSYSVETATGVKWDDIGGQDEAKRTLVEVLEDPIKHAALHGGYNKRAVKGVLLFGPPGTGKTMLAKASANAIRELHGKAESDSAFIYVKGPEVLNMWVGNTEASIRSLFARAKEHKAEYGYPALIFIDEADALLGKRDSGHAGILSSTVVPTFLAEMDGMSESGAFVMLATNRPDVLDPAITREGRIDRKIKIDRPDVTASEKILALYLAKTKTSEAVEKLAATAAKALFSDEYPMYNIGIQSAGVIKFHLRNLVSGAMLAGIVDTAVAVAIRRDIDTKSKKPSGVALADMRAAVQQIVTANRALNHEDDLAHFVESNGHTTKQVNVIQRVAA